MDINSERLDQLLDEIEIVRRRKLSDSESEEDQLNDIYYIDPNGFIPKLKVNNNHIIYGRRGSGKTSLLLAAIKDTQNLTVKIDSQVFRSVKASDITITILLRILKKIFVYISSSSEYRKILYDYKREFTGISGAIHLFRRDKTIEDRFLEYKKILEILRNLIKGLSTLKSADEEEQYSVKSQSKVSTHASTEQTKESKKAVQMTIGSKYDFSSLTTSLNSIFSLSYSHKQGTVTSNKEEKEEAEEVEYIKEKTVRKEDLLNNLKESIWELFNYFYDITGLRIVLYLDDFYQIHLNDQPFVIQYLHDIYKNCYKSCFCFKVCSIPYMLRINKPGENHFTHKDDFSQISLDANLSELRNRTDYLINIICATKPSLEFTPNEIEGLFNNEEVLFYTVIATGAVPRDFLIMFADLIRKARADRSDNINKEHVYGVINALKEDKENNIVNDSDIDPELIKKACNLIEDIVVGQLNTNVILYPMALNKRDEDLLKNLVNLRYFHVIKESTSSENKKKEEFVAYLIDMTFYATHKRMKPGFGFRKFWERDNESRLKQLDSAPIWYFPESFS